MTLTTRLTQYPSPRLNPAALAGRSQLVPSGLAGSHYEDDLHPDTVELQSETAAFFAATEGTYSNEDKSALNTFIKSLKDAEVWSILDCIQIYAFGDTQSDSLLNIKSSSFAASVVNSPSWARRQGFTSSSAGSRYVNSNFTPSTAAGSFAQNSAYLANYCRTSNAASGNTDIGAIGTNRAFLRNFFTGSLLQASLTHSSTTTYTASVAGSQGFSAAARTINTTINLYKNNTDLGSGAVTSSGLPTVPIFVGCMNNSGSPAQFANSQCAAIAVGGYLSFIQHQSLYSALQTLLTYLGANV